MAAFAAAGVNTFAPNPLPERGSSFPIDSNGEWLAYGSGYSVVLRNVANPSDCKVLVGHRKAVRVARFSPDGKLVASGDEGGQLKVFDANTMDVKKEMPVLGGPLFDIAFDGTGKRMAVCGDCKGINSRAFMWESGTAQGELAGSAKRVLSIAIRPDNPCKLAYGTEDFLVKLHNGPPFKFSHSFEGHTNFVQCVRYSPCGSLLASAGSDKVINILDGESGELKLKLPVEHKGSVYAVSWSDDAKKLLSCSGDKTVKLWDVEAGKCISSVTMGRNVNDMQVGCVMAGAQPVSLSLSGDINYFDFNAGKVSNIIQAHTSMPLNIARDWSSDASEVYVGTHDGDVFGYTADGTGVRFEGAKPGTNDGIVVNKGKLYSAGHDDTLRSADVSDGKFAFNSSTASIGATPLGLDSPPSDPGLAVTCTEEGVMLYRDGRLCDHKQIKKYQPTCVAISREGTEVCVGGSDKAGHIFKVSGDKLEATDITLDKLQGPAAAVAYGEGVIAIGDTVKEITLWDQSSRECKIRNKWVFHASRINALSFSPDATHLASAGQDGQIVIWDVAKPLRKTKMPNCHLGGASSVCWLNNTTIMTAGGDGCLRKWEPKMP